jgi:NADH-quinone oxidoreductase subunit J
MIVTFYLFAAVAMLFSLVILFTKNVLYAAFSLVIVFFSLAGIYILLGAPFVGVTQVLVYIGGVIVFIIFGVMLTTRLNDQQVLSETHNRWVGYGIGMMLLVGYSLMIGRIDFQQLQPSLAAENGGDVARIGTLLMSDYLIPFELSGILLLIALIGATVIAGRRKEKEL